ncbi:uncharacterized protein LOC135923999 [Gordionus sp. m RMFG-2023]|uniref:uncharacterized protein LOC135923999 n=1 Tax=Gordionus sp. m RMFG-2023 TaxID=3053472 RepID=UPI0031FE1397
MASVFQGLEGVYYYVDDVLVTGITPEQHNQRLEEVFKPIRDKGLRASKEKSVLGVTEVIYLRTSDKRNGGVHFEWEIEQKNAFEILKEKIGEVPILVCFNNDLEIILAVDVSNKGVGGALLHLIDGLERPIIFFSRKDNKELMLSPRLQRWLLLVGSFNMEIRYRRGKENCLPDILSRLESSEEDLDVNKNIIVNKERALICSLSYMLKGGPTNWEDLKSNTLRDKELSRELSVVDDCLIRGNRAVIPLKLRSKIIRLLHAGHQGRDKIKYWAREYLSWPGIGDHIEKFTRSCIPCNSCAAMPERNRQLLAQTSKAVGALWARFGIPKTIVSDEGPAFIAENFKKFCNSLEIKPVLAPSYHPSSNGQAERMVAIVKNWIKKSKQENNDLWMAHLTGRELHQWSCFGEEGLECRWIS